MAITITYLREKPGLYISTDGRVVIKRVKSQQTYRADEIGWEAYIDGVLIGIMEDTLKECKERVEKWI